MQIIRFIIIPAARQSGFWGVGWVPPNGRAAALSAVLPPTAPFLAAQKWGKKPPAPFGLDPAFVQSDASRFAAAQPLNFCGASGLLVIGAVSVSLRLTALVLIGVSYYAKNKCIYPFKRATAEAGRAARRRSDAKTLIQWQGSIKSDTGQLGKQRGSGVSPAVFPPTFGRPKVGPPEASRLKVRKRATWKQLLSKTI